MDFGFTEREAEILSLASQGLSDAEIAERCGAPRSTVSTCWGRIMRRTSTGSREDALVVAGTDHNIGTPKAKLLTVREVEALHRQEHKRYKTLADRAASNSEEWSQRLVAFYENGAAYHLREYERMSRDPFKDRLVLFEGIDPRIKLPGT